MACGCQLAVVAALRRWPSSQNVVPLDRAHGEKGYLVVEIYEAFHLITLPAPARPPS